MSTVDLIFPKERVVCFFCQKPLLNRHRRYVDLSLCTTAGVAVLIAGLNEFRLANSKPVSSK